MNYLLASTKTRRFSFGRFLCLSLLWQILSSVDRRGNCEGVIADTARNDEGHSPVGEGYPEREGTMKDTQEYQWSMGHGQCPVCCGPSPHKQWWTETIGHKRTCKLAKLMKRAGDSVVWEHKNPERAIGWYWNEKGFLCSIRANDPDREEKLKLRSADPPFWSKITENGK